jgi:amino acid adenylation domain-containing protein
VTETPTAFPRPGDGKPLDAAERVRALEERLRAARRRLAEVRLPAGGVIPARPAELGNTAPLSVGQEQLWFIYRLAPSLGVYNIPFALRLRGSLDIEAATSALNRVVARHDALRTRIEVRDGAAVQVISDPVPFRLPEPVTVPEAGLPAALDQDASAPFDLERGPLIRFGLLRLSGDDHVLTATMHHICSDGWSAWLLASEIAECYSAAVRGRQPDLPELPVQYPDFTAWERDRLARGELDDHLRYWEQQLAGLMPLEFPTDRPRPPAPSFHGETLRPEIPPDLVVKLRELARASSASLFMVLMAAFNVVLARYTGQDQIVLGTATGGRERKEVEPLIGLFTNMVVLRTDLSGDPAFRDVLARAKEVTLAAYDHESVPFAKVVERLRPARDPSRNPLIQIAFGLVPSEMLQQLAMPGLTGEIVTGDQVTSRLDIAINVMESESAVTIQLEYATDLFDRARMERMVGHLVSVLREVAEDPGLRVSEAGLLSAAEREQVLSQWQGQPRPYRRELVHALVAEQAAATPDAAAVVFGDASLTYAELAGSARALARALRQRGVDRGDMVAVFCERSLWAPVALLGVLTAGAAYVPLEASHPAGRLRWILADCGARVVVTHSSLAGRVPGGDWEVVCVDEGAAAPGADAPLPEVADLECPAYVLYTSGSTGRPKGVVVEHHALATYIDWLGGLLGAGTGDRMMPFSSLIFDVAHGDLFTGLARGAAVVFPPAEATVSPQGLSELMRAQRITYLGAPPAVIAVLEPGPYPCLRGVLVAGEVFSGDLVNRWNLPGRLFVNAYGPTEATVACTFYLCERKVWTSSPPIGRAMPNRRAYLLDRWGNPVPAGVPGEIVIAGDGLARGYLNNPELTAAKFTADPFVPGARAYHSGDLGVWTPDGQIQFLGRLDTQIKLRGQRIELEEIEATLATHPGVARAVAALRHDLPGGDGIAAYILPAPGEAPPAPGELREHLAAMLPGYMVPAAYVTLSELPLSPTGKVSRAALPPASPRDAIHAPYTPLRSPTEHLVAAIYTDLLGHPGIGAHDSFFDLGGNSLQAAAVLDRITQLTGARIPLRRFLTEPTVSATARAAEEAAAQGTGGPAAPVAGHQSLVPLKATGSRSPLFCLPQASGSAYSYLALARRVDAEQPVLAFEPPGLADDTAAPLESIDDLAVHYLAEVAERQPGGPYHLAGYSMGALVAFEMARRLADAGHKVAMLALIDPPTPPLTPAPSPAQLVSLFAEDLAFAAGVPEIPLGSITGRVQPDGSLDADSLAELLTVLQQAGLLPDGLSPEFLRRRLAVYAASARAMAAYQPAAPSSGRITLIRAERSPDTRAYWRAWAAGLDDAVVPGNHFTIWHEPNVATLASVLRRRLEEAG